MKDLVEWIEINLPWSAEISWEGMPEPPNLSDKEKEVFGSSLQELEEDNKGYIEEYSKLVDQLSSLKNRDNSLSSDEIENIEVSFWKEHEQDLCVIKRDAFIDLRHKIYDWSDEQLEWKAYDKAKKDFIVEQGKNSFCGRGLAKAGTLIEMENGSIHLIGSINESGGVCNDCMSFDKDAIVSKYAVVYSFRKARIMKTNEDVIPMYPWWQIFLMSAFDIDFNKTKWTPSTDSEVRALGVLIPKYSLWQMVKMTLLQIEG